MKKNLTEIEGLFLNGFNEKNGVLNITNPVKEDISNLDSLYNIDDFINLLKKITFFLDNNYEFTIDSSSLDSLLTKIDDFVESGTSSSDDVINKLLTRSFTLKLEKYVQTITGGEEAGLAANKFLEEVNEFLESKKTHNFTTDNFSYNLINTIFSYANYLLPFVNNVELQNSFLNLQTEYILKQNVEDILKINYDVLTTIYLGNLSYLILNNCLEKKYLSEILEKLDVSELTKYSSFLEEYSGFDMKSYILKKEIKFNNYSYASLLNLKRIEDKKALSYLLANYSYHSWIRRFSSIYYKQLGTEYSIINLNNSYLISGLDEYFLSFESFFSSLDNERDIIKFFKIFLIKFLNLPTNTSGFKFALRKGDKEIISLFTNKISYNYHYTINFDGFELSIYSLVKLPIFELNVNVNLQEENFIDKLSENRTKIVRVLEIIEEKKNKADLFLQSIGTKINKLKSTHPETFEHMDRLGKIFGFLSFSFYKQGLSFIKERFFLRSLKVFPFIGYLHDIGKADNIENLIKLNNFNGRTAPTVAFYFYMLNNYLGLNGDSKNIEQLSFDKDKFNEIINELVFHIIDNNSSLVDEIKKVFGDKFDLIGFLNPQLFSIQISDIIKKIKKYLRDILGNRKLLKEILSYDLLTISIKNKNEKEINLELISVLLLFKIVARLKVKQLQEPHITYGMHFFVAHPEFKDLSWVLFHHYDYPKLGEVKKYGILEGLERWGKVVGKSLEDYFPDLDDDNAYLKPENKDIMMILLTSLDILDAKLGNRSYQNVDTSEFDAVRAILNPDFVEYLDGFLKIEDLSDKNKVFDSTIEILDKDFKNNSDWPAIEEVLLDNKDKILNLYR